MKLYSNSTNKPFVFTNNDDDDDPQKLHKISTGIAARAHKEVRIRTSLFLHRKTYESLSLCSVFCAENSSHFRHSWLYSPLDVCFVQCVINYPALTESGSASNVKDTSLLVLCNQYMDNTFIIHRRENSFPGLNGQWIKQHLYSNIETICGHQVFSTGQILTFIIIGNKLLSYPKTEIHILPIWQWYETAKNVVLVNRTAYDSFLF